MGGPPSLEQAIHSLPFEAPFTEKATEVHAPAAPEREATCSPSRRRSAHAFTVGAVNLRAATALNTKLAESSQALAEFAQNPIVPARPRRLHRTRSNSANPLLAGLAPEQAYCNYLTLAFRNLASLESENIGVGTLARAGFVLAPNGPNNEGYPSSAPANGPSVEHAVSEHERIIDNNHLHANPYPNVAGPGQPRGTAKPATRPTCRAKP